MQFIREKADSWVTIIGRTMRFWGVVLGLIFLGKLAAEGRAPPIFVSLGAQCEIAISLRTAKLRQAALPFDWIQTVDTKRVAQILDEDFEHFLKDEDFIEHPTNPFVLENKHYEIAMRHEWPFPSLEIPDQEDTSLYGCMLASVQEKYPRRIARFRQLKDYPGKVVFFRTPHDFQVDPNPFWGEERHASITSEEARCLKEALDHYFPGLDFTLVIINFSEVQGAPIDSIDNVFEYKIRKSHKQQDWKLLLQTLNLSH